MQTRPPADVRSALKIVNDFNRLGIGMIAVQINGEWYPDRESYVVEAFKIVNEYYRKNKNNGIIA